MTGRHRRQAVVGRAKTVGEGQHADRDADQAEQQQGAASHPVDQENREDVNTRFMRPTSTACMNDACVPMPDCSKIIGA